MTFFDILRRAGISISTSNPRITVPYSFTNTRVDATAGYDLKVVTIEGGLRHTAIDRTRGSRLAAVVGDGFGLADRAPTGKCSNRKRNVKSGH